MSKKVVDVSSYNGKIDWAKVKKSGVQGAILKIIRKDLNPDTQFENNWNGCVKANMPITGVYNYSYATTVAKAKNDARKVLEVLNGRKAVVWLDVEDACMKGLGRNLIYIVEAYQRIIEDAGLDFGVYTGLSFYNTYFKPYAGTLSDVGFWIARYPSSTQHPVATFAPDKYQPSINHILVGWQYSSKCQVPGIAGNTDISDWYYSVDPTVMEYADYVKFNPYPVPTKILKYKSFPMMHGDDVKWVQYHLVRLHYLDEFNEKGKSNIDGWYGNDTTNAVLKFQARHGLLVDGIVGANTRDALKLY